MKGNTHPDYQQTSLKAREEAFTSKVNDVINTEILGRGNNKWQFTVPLEVSKTSGEGNVIGTISIENTKARALVENIEKIVPVCLPPEESGRIQKQTDAITNYRESMKIVRKKEGTYTSEELKSYQRHMSIFGNIWIELHSKRGMTNYIHMGISGHILEYMVEWGNLYKYSQQGWESLNSLIKKFFFLRTNKGGGKSDNRSRLLPIARLFQRQLLWISGFADKFLSHEDDGEQYLSDNMDDDDEFAIINV